MLKKPYLKVQILQYNFWIENDPPLPPPFGTFPKIHPIWKRGAPLTLASQQMEKGANVKVYHGSEARQHENV